MSHKHTQNGFTILELMIATTVFSVLLLLCTTAIIQIGRVYNKGITAARTQEVARTITEEVSRSIQFSAAPIIPDNQLVHEPTSTAKGFCLGNRLFSYVLDKRKTTGTPNATQSKYVFVVKDINKCLPGTTEVQAIDLTAPPHPIEGRELVGLHMRLIVDPKPEPITPGSSLYKINVKVVYGDPIDFDTGPPPSCKPIRQGGPFCALSAYNTIIEKRVQ